MNPSCSCPAREWAAVRDHVLKCGLCHVHANGSVSYCSMANAIIQRLRKQQFFERDGK